MYKTIAFDLDDTLLDTTGLLVTQASQRAFQFLIDNGLRLSLVECEAKRLEMIRRVSHRDVFQILAKDFGDDSTQKAAPIASDYFYQPELPATLPCLPGAIENLDYLKSKYTLYLVTAGSEPAQNQKVDSLKIRNYFKDIFVVNSSTKQRKLEAFKEILSRELHPADKLLCIGNSMSSEIADALTLGAGACFFDFGEDRGQADHVEKLKPHYHIRTHGELIKTCRL